MADKRAAGYSAVDLSKMTHEWRGLPSIVSTRPNELIEIFGEHFLLCREVALERFTSEETVQAFAKVDMPLSVEEYPGTGTDKILRDRYNAWLDICWRIEDFAC